MPEASEQSSVSFIQSHNRIEKHRRLIEEAHMKAIEQALQIIESHEAIITQAMEAIISACGTRTKFGIRQNIPIIVDNK